MQEDLLTVKEVAAYLKISIFTVREMIKAGRLKAIKVGKSYRIKRSELEKFLATV